MADIPGNLLKMNDIEIAQEAPLTESLFLKLGANINALIDRVIDVQTFTANGNYTVPGPVGSNARLIIFGCGGGSGGNGAAARQSGESALLISNGAGGHGAALGIVQSLQVSETIIPITIGAGGTGGTGGNNVTLPTISSAGGDSTFGSIATFKGAPNPSRYIQSTAPVWEFDPVRDDVGAGVHGGLPRVRRQTVNAFVVLQQQVKVATPGGNSEFFDGGAIGVTTGFSVGGAGGAAGPFGDGGDGGDGAAAAGGLGNAGSSAAANTGAGGGGASANGDTVAPATFSPNGGDGGSGVITVLAFVE